MINPFIVIELQNEINELKRKLTQAETRTTELADMVLVHDKRATDLLRDTNALRNVVRMQAGLIDKDDHRYTELNKLKEEILT